METATSSPSPVRTQALNKLLANWSETLRLNPENHLFWRGDAFQSLYLICSGVLKSYNVDMDGNERINQFHFPGDLIGLDAIAEGQHLWNAIPLTPAVLVAVPFEYLIGVAANGDKQAADLFRWLSREVVAAAHLAGDYTATERVASFLVEMHRRSPGPGGTNRVTLVMSRREIGNYLRLATETVSRIMTKLDQQGLIRAEGRSIDLLELDKLRELAMPVLCNE